MKNAQRTQEMLERERTNRRSRAYATQQEKRDNNWTNADCNKAKEDLEKMDKWENLRINLINKAADTSSDLAKTYVESKQREKGLKEQAKRYIAGLTSFFTNPYYVATLTGIPIGIYYGGKILHKQIDKHLNKPSVIEETNIKSGLQKLFGMFGSEEEEKESRINEIVAPQRIKDRILEIADIFKTAHENDEPMPNVLFYGPPGTGKTLTARALALES